MFSIRAAAECCDLNSQKAVRPPTPRQRRGAGTEPEVSVCFWRNCDARPSDSRALFRHLDTHFPHRFMCVRCKRTFTRPLTSGGHPHRNELVVDPVPYWQNPKYKNELRRPEEGHLIWGDPAYEENNLQWYHHLPRIWEGIEP